MTITTHDGLTLTGTPTALVAALRHRSHTPSTSPRDFMRQTAARVLLWNQTRVDTVTPASFLAGLATAGLLTMTEAQLELC